jgi:hypothetical protein
MIQVLQSIGWVVLWAITLHCSLGAASIIIKDHDLDDVGFIIGFVATPILWAILIVFWFN